MNSLAVPALGMNAVLGYGAPQTWTEAFRRLPAVPSVPTAPLAAARGRPLPPLAPPRPLLRAAGFGVSCAFDLSRETQQVRTGDAHGTNRRRTRPPLGSDGGARGRTGQPRAMLGDDSTWRLPRSCSSRPQPRPLAEIPATRSRDPRGPRDAGRLKFTGHAYPLSTVERPGTALASGSCRHFRLRAERANCALCTTPGSGHPGAPRASLSAMGMGKSWGRGARETPRGDQHSLGS